MAKDHKPSKNISLFQLFKKLSHYIKPYKYIVIATLVLTLIGAFLAQVNALVLRYVVDELTVLQNKIITVKN